MIEEKKQFILTKSMHLFSERGFYKTSVQDIAEACRMSKASIYKYFENKEDILLNIATHNRDQMIARSEAIQMDTSLTPREAFKAKVMEEIRGFIGKREFIYMLQQAKPQQSHRVNELMNQSYGILLNWHKNMLLEGFGSDVQANIWDLTILFKGFTREITLLLDKKREENVDYEAIAEFVASSIEAVIASRKSTEPLFTSAYMAPFIEEVEKNSTSHLRKDGTTVCWNFRLLLKQNYRKKNMNIFNRLSGSLKKKWPERM
ncbi:TetR/AcrR family transcriptional regulator [Sinobaca sp. H24]|uniref:TetR/AcrR family transcriptional regulator n=1 Tax=Sinobaca sp. H24 TaxID=2923376 RepID=UPI00207ACDB9|nr:TetR/AcrR family transcriptional regulator [Sinobaca sp. H24]